MHSQRVWRRVKKIIMLTSQMFLVHGKYNTKMLIENVIHMLKTKISYFWIEKMLVKPLGVKTKNVKFWPLGPFSHDASQLYFLTFNQAFLTKKKELMWLILIWLDDVLKDGTYLQIIILSCKIVYSDWLRHIW